MSKSMVKKCITALCVVMATCFMAMLAPVFAVSANTEKTLNDVNFSMMNGATIRAMETSGIRFAGVMSEEDATWLNDNYDSVSFGTFIMPADYQVKYGALTEDKLFGNNAVYFWDGKVKTNETVEILQMYGELHFDSIEQKMMVKGSIAPVLTQNLNREFVGVCYAELVKGSDVDYLFATPNDNERTVVYVAQKSLDLGLVEEEQIPTVEGLISGYINAYKQANDNAMPTVSYTVNQIFDDGTATNQIVVNDAELDSTVTLDLNDYAKNGYTIDEAKSVVSGRAYAQDKLVLDVYYNNIEYAKKSTWLTSDSSRFETVTYVGENSWIAEPKDKGASANFYNIKLSTSAVTELLNAGTPVVTLTFTGYNAPLTEITLEHDWSVFPAGAVRTSSENMIKVTYTLTESMKTSAPNVMFYFRHQANCEVKVTLTAQAKQATWLSSESIRFQSVEYVDNYWVAKPKADGTSNFYNISLSTDAVKDLMAENKTVVTFKYEPMAGTTVSAIVFANASSIFPANTMTSQSGSVATVSYVLTEDMKTSAPNVMFYISHSANASFKITMTAEEFVCGNGWLAGVAEEVSGANCYPSYLGYEKQSYNIIFGNDSGTKQYQITAKAVNELLAKGFTKVKMTITLKDGEAFISCLSNAGGQVLSSKAKNTDSKTYTLTADTPILASFYIRKLNATEATNAGFSEVPPMTGFTVQLVGVK